MEGGGSRSSWQVTLRGYWDMQRQMHSCGRPLQHGRRRQQKQLAKK
jgi:hypothetical protein